jgi:hypothetical protein
MSYISQALLLVAALYRKGAITLQVKSTLKDLILQNDPLVKSVVEAFFVDLDLVEVVDSFTRVLESMYIWCVIVVCLRIHFSKQTWLTLRSNKAPL